jgi:hypothetical protein
MNTQKVFFEGTEETRLILISDDEEAVFNVDTDIEESKKNFKKSILETNDTTNRIFYLNTYVPGYTNFIPYLLFSFRNEKTIFTERIFFLNFLDRVLAKMGWLGFDKIHRKILRISENNPISKEYSYWEIDSIDLINSVKNM